MTLVVGLAGKSEVILAAERLCLLGDSDGQYSGKESKIRLLGDAAFGFAASRSGFSLFETIAQREGLAAGESLGERIKSFLWAMGREYSVNHSTDDVRLLACGIDNGEPTIYVANFVRGIVAGPTNVTEGRIAIGIEKHGALHFFHRYHRRDMTASELAFLAYFSISETVFHDGRVKKPIDVYVIRQGDTSTLGEREIAFLDKASKKATDKVGKVLMGMAPDLNL